jgi:antitoxin YefM
MKALKISEDLHPMTALKSKGADIVRQVNSTGRPVVLTRHGKGVAVVLSIKTYEELQATIKRASLREALAAGLRDIEEGRVVSHSEILAKLDAWDADDSKD